MAGHSTSLEQRQEVVVVDDDAAVLHSLKFALELEGYSVSAYRDAAGVLARATFPERGCLIVDYKLPDMNGLDMLAALRARGTTTPAVLIATAPGEAVMRRAAAAHVSVVEKPLLGDTLNQAIAAAFDGAGR